MKKLGIFLLSIIIIGLLFVAGFFAGMYGQSLISPRETDSELSDATENTTSSEEENVEEVETYSKELIMYDSIFEAYKEAMEKYESEEYSQETLEKKYSLVNADLIAHVSRYKSNDVKLTYGFYDIDQNDVRELVIGASGTPGAIYSYDTEKEEPVKIYYQSTLERGNLSMYDNGIILSHGSGGATLHYYEFGKIADDGISFESIEEIEEEYKGENTNSIYRNFNTRKKLEYKDIDEIMNKYVSDSKEIKIKDYSELE